MERYFSFIRRLINKKTGGEGLGVFRIVYSMVFLCEVAQLFNFRHLIFDKVPFIEPSDMDTTPAMICWMIAIVFLMFGCFTRQAALLNYLFSIVFIATLKTYEYHMFYLYMGINALLIFVNTSSCYSIDVLRTRLKTSWSPAFPPNNSRVSVLNYHALVLIGIAFVYFDSVFFKFDSSLWRNGLGLWLPASVPQVAFLDYQWLLDQKAVVIFLGYLTLFFEVVFLFLFGFRKFWPYLFVIGICLHLGILLVFPIPWFALGVIAFYLLLIPASFWRRLFARLKADTPKFSLTFKEQNTFLRKCAITLSFFDVFDVFKLNVAQNGASQEVDDGDGGKSNPVFILSTVSNGHTLSGFKAFRKACLFVPGLFLPGLLLFLPGVAHVAGSIFCKLGQSSNPPAGSNFSRKEVVPADQIAVADVAIWKTYLVGSAFLVLTMLQVISTYRSPLITRVVKSAGIENTFVGKLLKNISWESQKFSKTYFGITGHSVFLDSHFEGYNHIIALEFIGENGERKWLPIIEKDGRPGCLLSGPTWAKWSFRINGPSVNEDNLLSGFRDFTAYWLIKNDMPVDGAKFIVWVKKIRTPQSWEKGFLKSQRNQQWIEAGTGFWEKQKFILKVKDVESI
ncbi:HTTM domain-containing protein [Parasegetibacter sp. NRK P23]|uniref:HTTM domain-containing protein n=1 Tax=Parasegetibacter sp. NRK P23 TaxID=2942999 RepID=UPI002043A308|nr:HTTM domain-containing protein [Parasegetibacter sp. NRK P23]MCM5527640.1 HTTM domain-containing protein [Parasegetibacter sp. NRK P23]